MASVLVSRLSVPNHGVAGGPGELVLMKLPPGGLCLGLCRVHLSVGETTLACTASFNNHSFFALSVFLGMFVFFVY